MGTVEAGWLGCKVIGGKAQHTRQWLHSTRGRQLCIHQLCQVFTILQRGDLTRIASCKGMGSQGRATYDGRQVDLIVGLVGESSRIPCLMAAFTVGRMLSIRSHTKRSWEAGGLPGGAWRIFIAD